MTLKHRGGSTVLVKSTHYISHEGAGGCTEGNCCYFTLAGVNTLNLVANALWSWSIFWSQIVQFKGEMVLAPSPFCQHHAGSGRQDEPLPFPSPLLLPASPRFSLQRAEQR